MPQLRSQWHWFDHFILLLRSIWLVGSFIQYSALIVFSPLHWLLPVWISLSFALPLLYFRPGRLDVHRYYAAEFLLTGSLYFYLVYYGEIQALRFIGLQVMIFGYLGTKTTAAKVVAGLLFVLLIPFTNAAGHFHASLWEMTLKLFDFVLFYGVGACFHQVVRQHQIIKEKNKALEQYTMVIERLTLTEERNRMARDMHDTIGHTFISAITGLTAVKYLMRSNLAEAEKSIDELLEVTRGGLQEIRQSIHQLSDGDDADAGSLLSDRLKHLAEKFGGYTNTKIDFKHSGSEADRYSETIANTLTRFLQESLTNAKRHGMAPAIEIRLLFRDSEIELTVRDFGQGARKLKEGFGIRAMRERIAAIQGSLSIRSQPDAGTTVHCTIPLRGDIRHA